MKTKCITIKIPIASARLVAAILHVAVIERKMIAPESSPKRLKNDKEEIRLIRKARKRILRSIHKADNR